MRRWKKFLFIKLPLLLLLLSLLWVTVLKVVPVYWTPLMTKRAMQYKPEEKIKTRYYRSLDNLYNAVLKSDRAFLIDNSGKKHELIAEYDKSINTLNFASNYYPEWVQKYFIDKNNSAE